MPFLFFSPMYLLFTIPAVVLALYAQWRVSSAYKKYSEISNDQRMTGADVARVLMRNEGLDHVQIEVIPGNMTDHYDPQGKIMRLSEGSARYSSVAAMAIVAHELGHASQDKSGYAWLQLRSGIVGIANIGSQLGTIVLFIGMGIAFFFNGNLTVAWIGVLLMSAAVVFSLVTLPVEFDASSRARQMLARAGMMSTQESQGVSAVLNAAALTYVAGAAQAIMQLLYWVTVLSGMSRRE
ncbi:MAG: zinc metallopeptidase [Roseiflexaceae bacterium]|nr:zinc metallopeptidase [Roseiflexaceae bacterium]